MDNDKKAASEIKGTLKMTQPVENSKKTVKVIVRKARFLGVKKTLPCSETVVKRNTITDSKEEQKILRNEIEKILNKYNLSTYLKGIPDNDELNLLHKLYLEGRSPQLSKKINDLYISQKKDIDLSRRASSISNAADREALIKKINALNIITKENVQRGIIEAIDSTALEKQYLQDKMQEINDALKNKDAEISNLNKELAMVKQYLEKTKAKLEIKEKELKAAQQKISSITDIINEATATNQIDDYTPKIGAEICCTDLSNELKAEKKSENYTKYIKNLDDVSTSENHNIELTPKHLERLHQMGNSWFVSYMYHFYDPSHENWKLTLNSFRTGYFKYTKDVHYQFLEKISNANEAALGRNQIDLSGAEVRRMAKELLANWNTVSLNKEYLEETSAVLGIKEKELKPTQQKISSFSDIINDMTVDNQSDDFSELKVGEIARKYLAKALSTKATPYELRSFQQQDYSEQILGIKFPLLSCTRKISENDIDRYYSGKTVGTVSIDGAEFYICSQWYEWNKEQLIKWLKQHGIE